MHHSINFEEFQALPFRVASRLQILFDTGCWIWRGSDSGTGKGGGYPRISWQGRTTAVHRLVWFLLRGYWPRFQLDHRCERRACCNPVHAKPCTNRTNNRLRVKRARKRDGKPAWSSREFRNAERMAIQAAQGTDFRGLSAGSIPWAIADADHGPRIDQNSSTDPIL